MRRRRRRTDGTVSLKRAGPAPAGAHAISGQWTPERVQDMTEEALNISYEIDGNKVKSTVQGQTYEAELVDPRFRSRTIQAERLSR